MAKIRPGGRKTAHRAAEQPPTGKLKLSRITSGYGGLKIPLGQIRLNAKNGGYMGGFAALHSDFSVEGPKRAFLALFWAPGGLGSIFFRI